MKNMVGFSFCDLGGMSYEVLKNESQLVSYTDQLINIHTLNGCLCLRIAQF